MINKKHIGSDFDEFLSSKGMPEKSEAVAIKRVIAYELSKKWQKIK